MKYRAYTKAFLITGHNNPPIIESSTILVNDKGRIDEVGAANSITIPPNYEIIDLSGHYLMPGLINGHVHFVTKGTMGKTPSGFVKEILKNVLSTPLGKMLLKKQYKDCLHTALNAGITSVRDLGSLFELDTYYRTRISKGKQKGPRILASGAPVIPTGGHGSEYPGAGIADGPWEGRKRVRERIAQGVDWIKICNTGGVTDAKYIGEAGMPQMTVEEIEAICSEAHMRGIMVASHCESTKGIADALAGGVDTIEHGADFGPELAAQFLNNPKALRGYTSLIPTIAASDAVCRQLEAQDQQNEIDKIVLANAKLINAGSQLALKKALEYGVKVGIGDDASVPGVTHYNLYKELINFTKGGLSPLEAIQTATYHTAQILNIDKITGSIEPGKEADFIVLQNNPLDNLESLYKPKHVVARGYYMKTPRFKNLGL
ncbi:amidohydrolase family protein [Spirochaeta cellobiosiphila]|uniref:amidohydrolase family protein n=1 Tax=Spirochaeta cellobiosiphila TaxID=504483 RepID=UPI0003F90ADF|nr:amidohydrolase family protein [Spirochaeta cellobiosiphila]